jgi:hypothetical protein
MSSALDDPTYLNLHYDFESIYNATNLASNNVGSLLFHGNRDYVTLMNGATLDSTVKKFGSKSLNLTANNSYLELPEFRMEGWEHFGFALWFKTNKSTGVYSIFSAGKNPSKSLCLQIEAANNHFYINNQSSSNNYNYPKPLNDNEWHHVAITFNISANRELKYYIDGVLFITETNITFQDINDSPYTPFTFIGRTYWDVNYLSGYVDDFRFYYNKTLTAEEVASLYDRGIPHDVVCFLEGTQITCLDDETAEEIQIQIEDITPGTLVKTYLHGFIPVDCINYKMIENPTDTKRVKNRLYKCSPEKYPSLKKDLIMTGTHAILEDTLSDQQKDITLKELGKVFVTDEKYRLMAMADERAVPYVTKTKQSKVWHMCLEHEDYEMNYGIYANGLLVESCSKRNMDLGML